MLQTPLLLMKGLSKTNIPIFKSAVCSLFPKQIFLTFVLLHCSRCYCRVAAIDRRPVYHHSAESISFCLGSLGH